MNMSWLTRTCPAISDYKEKGVIGHDLWVQHQSPCQGNHSYRRDGGGKKERTKEKSITF